MRKYLYAGITAAIALAAGLVPVANATLIAPPSYSDIVTATSTTFGTSLFSDLLPWIGVLLLITVVGLILAALARRISGAFKRVFGGGRGRRGGRRRYR